MKVVVLGATGNVGTSLLQALQESSSVDSIVGIARRAPLARFAKTEWRQADVSTDDLISHFRGADVVVDLAWAIQPSRDERLLYATNVQGTSRVLDAVARAEVPALVFGSSVGAYSRGPKDRRVDESWPVGGTPTSFYGRHKAICEQLLDRFEQQHPEVRVVRLRPGLVFKAEAATGIRRLFLGPLAPTFFLQPGRLPVLPLAPRLRFQAVHSLDVGRAYRAAIEKDVRGAFNIAAEPTLGPENLGHLLQTKVVEVPEQVLRAGAAASWRLRLQPTPEGWVDLALNVPLMDTSRAHDELAWEPLRGADSALLELLEGMRRGEGLGTPPLASGAGFMRS
ncbi:MAG: NAD-dependent epimerase/dehydratase family protein [Actinomycetota bacterium]|nr:NAD-dependent epimerase/dehydratase family protein [Actinomycetota bacterium]